MDLVVPIDPQMSENSQEGEGENTPQEYLAGEEESHVVGPTLSRCMGKSGCWTADAGGQLIWELE